jgi:hypothetical protein
MIEVKSDGRFLVPELAIASRIIRAYLAHCRQHSFKTAWRGASKWRDISTPDYLLRLGAYSLYKWDNPSLSGALPPTFIQERLARTSKCRKHFDP